MNRFNLPDIHFLKKSPEDIERDMLSYIEKKTGIKLSNADPRRKFLQALVLYIVQERNNLDYALKQNLLSYADGEFLDHKGEDFQVHRLKAKPAKTMMEFILEEERVDTLVIPKGTRFLVGESTFFATDETCIVPKGQHTVHIGATCLENGKVGNGYLPGEITTLVDPIPWVKEVRNITTSDGGAEVEDDDSYAHRIHIAPESFSVAGPEGAYEYWAKTAHQEIVDVVVLNPSPGVVDIRVLLANGELPSEEILEQVLSVCSDKKVRPLTDYVIVNQPEIVTYDIDVEYYILYSNAGMANSIQQNVNEAFQGYLRWQKEKLGRDVDLSELIARLKKAGAYRVTVNSPMYKKIEKHQVAKENIVNFSFGGLTDE
ncbi:baseplate J/gp47 family protein [Anoxybacillus ayderensis]|uniref:baseplate assembly protein n=1 Tax=Anoxybacillus ayderensis TaxID=265546 RepID=UPI002E1CB889|nr:baseplate J/gp47 family protein [Anoxybacillus ayderensis]